MENIKSIVKLVKIYPRTQKDLIDNYKKKLKLTWKDLGEKFGYSWSSFRIMFWQRSKPIPIEIFQELIRYLSKKEKTKLIQNSEIFEGKIIKRKTWKRDNTSAVRTMRKKYGKNFFRKIGKLGGSKQKFYWSKEKLLKQSFHGRLGGIKRIDGKILNEKEKILSEENKRLNLKFKPNYVLNENLNFDFVYFDSNNKINFVEESTLDPFRGLAYFVEKRKILDRKIGFFISYEKSTPDVLSVLLENKIIPVQNKMREIFLESIRDNNLNIKSFVKNTKDSIKVLSAYVSPLSKSCSLNELRKDYNEYEKIVYDAIKRSGLKTFGKKIIKSKNGTYFVPDNFVSHKGEEVAFLVSHCNSRGSLLYTLFKDASYGLLFKKALKSPVKSFSIIFDFSNTLTSEGISKPKEMWNKYCDYGLIVSKSNLKDLKDKIISVMGG